MLQENKKQNFRLKNLTWIVLGTMGALLVVFLAPVVFQADDWSHQMVFLIVIGLGLGLVEIRRLNLRLAHLAKVADSLGRGQYETRAETSGVDDAISLVGQGLNLMAKRVSESIAQIQESRDELAESKEKLTAQHEELTRAYERQAHFGEFLSRLHSIDIDTLAREAFAELVEAAKAQIGVLYLFDEQTQKLNLVAERGIDQAAMRDLLPQNSFEGLPGEAFNRREWILIDDLDSEALPEINLGFGAARLQSVYAIPLLFQNKALGVLILAGLQKTDKATIQLLRNYTNALANALSNALTYRTVQQQTVQVEKANSRLLDLDVHRRQFVAHMSHELRTPLNSIIGFSSILQKNRENDLTAENIERAEKINRNGKHLLKLINDILDLSKMEADRMETDLRLTQVNPVIRDVADMLQPQISAKNIAMNLILPEEPVTIVTDAGKLRQILINLASNAVKFTDEGAVTIRLLQPNEHSGVAIEVSDTGIGISDDKIDTIFEAFRQADNTTSRKYGGTGLGLTITRTLLTLLGGKIKVTSQVGKGSTFRLEFPNTPDIPQAQLAFESADDVLFPEESARLFESERAATSPDVN